VLIITTLYISYRAIYSHQDILGDRIPIPSFMVCYWENCTIFHYSNINLFNFWYQIYFQPYLHRMIRERHWNEPIMKYVLVCVCAWSYFNRKHTRRHRPHTQNKLSCRFFLRVREYTARLRMYVFTCVLHPKA